MSLYSVFTCLRGSVSVASFSSWRSWRINSSWSPKRPTRSLALYRHTLIYLNHIFHNTQILYRHCSHLLLYVCTNIAILFLVPTNKQEPPNFFKKSNQIHIKIIRIRNEHCIFPSISYYIHQFKAFHKVFKFIIIC